MLNLEIFFTIITIQKKTFIIFCYHNRTMKLPMFLKSSPTTTVLRNISLLFCWCFLSKIRKKLIFQHFSNSQYLFYRFNDFVNAYGNPRYKLLHTRKMLDSVGLKKVEDKNKQFLIEKIIHGVEFENFINLIQNKNLK